MWIAGPGKRLANKRDSWHQVAARGYEQIKADGWFLVTSDYVLDEVITSLFNYAWMLRNVYRDKADMSFTDLTSFVLMKELNISRAFTGDHHFEMTNLGFDIWPKEK